MSQHVYACNMEMYLSDSGFFPRDYPGFGRYFFVNFQQKTKKKPLHKEMKMLHKIMARERLHNYRFSMIWLHPVQTTDDNKMSQHRKRNPTKRPWFCCTPSSRTVSNTFC